MSLKIRNQENKNQTADLVRDVCHTHPAWVHAQLETEGESELQGMLDQVDLQEFMRSPGEEDQYTGIYWEGEVYRVSATFVDHNGVNCLANDPAQLGDYAYTRFATLFEAEEAAKGLASDEEEDSTVTYFAEIAR